MLELCVLDASAGDLRYKWDPKDPKSVKEAKETFKDLKDKGYLFFIPDEDDKPGKEITKFEEATGDLLFERKVIATPKPAGGPVDNPAEYMRIRIPVLR